MERRASTARDEVERLRSLAEAEEANATKLKEGVQAANRAISSTGEQALQEARHLASTKAEAAKWSTLVLKSHKDKSSTEQEWETLESQLADFVLD